MADARIRLRLDAKDAKRELSDLRHEFARTTDAAGQVGGGFNLSLGKVAAIGGIGLGGFALARGALGGGRAIGQAATEGASSVIEELALGQAGANARGSLQALQTIKQQAGLAVGYGASPESFRALFKQLQDVEQRAERGQLALSETFGGQVAADTLKNLLEETKNLPGRIVQGLKSIVGGW